MEESFVIFIALLIALLYRQWRYSIAPLAINSAMQRLWRWRKNLYWKQHYQEFIALQGIIVLVALFNCFSIAIQSLYSAIQRLNRAIEQRHQHYIAPYSTSGAIQSLFNRYLFTIQSIFNRYLIAIQRHIAILYIAIVQQLNNATSAIQRYSIVIQSL